MTAKDWRRVSQIPPPEPLFNHVCSMTKELLTEWINILSTENQALIAKASAMQGFFKNGMIVEALFTICEKFKLPSEAKFLSAELFDRFMVHHIQDLIELTMKMAKVNEINNDMCTTLIRLTNQISLRIISCCQIASKLTSHAQIVTASRAFLMLKSLGHKYRCNSMLQSELRILKTLKYTVMCLSPLLFVESVLEILGHSQVDIQLPTYHSSSLILLEIFYTKNEEIYAELFHYSVGCILTSATVDERSKFARVKTDYMLQACAILVATSYLIDSSNTDKVLTIISGITHIAVQDIEDFASVIIHCTLPK